MAARTESAAIIAVDSKISSKNSRPIAGERKLVDVGDRSACAIEGFLGYGDAPELDVSEVLRQWVRDHPKREADDALDDLLKAAAGRWDNGRYPLGHLPQDRQVGKGITVLVCAEMIRGRPWIFRGETYVNSDGTAGEHRFYPIFGGTLYVQGVFNTTSFNVVFTGSDKAIHETLPNATDIEISQLMAIRKDVRANSSAMNAIELWSGAATSAPKNAYYPAPPWRQPTVKNLFGVVFNSVEKNLPDIVGPPNNVRIISACGRKSSTVETAEPWPLCRAKKKTASH
jgi:hypothetical protein